MPQSQPTQVWIQEALTHQCRPRQQEEHIHQWVRMGVTAALVHQWILQVILQWMPPWDQLEGIAVYQPCSNQQEDTQAWMLLGIRIWLVPKPIWVLLKVILRWTKWPRTTHMQPPLLLMARMLTMLLWVILITQLFRIPSPCQSSPKPSNSHQGWSKLYARWMQWMLSWRSLI